MDSEKTKTAATKIQKTTSPHRILRIYFAFISCQFYYLFCICHLMHPFSPRATCTALVSSSFYRVLRHFLTLLRLPPNSQFFDPQLATISVLSPYPVSKLQ